MAMTRGEPVVLLVLATLAALAACSGGGAELTGEPKTGGNFLVLKTEPVNGGTIFLNDPVRIDFSSDVDLDSASLTTVSFKAFDQFGVLLSDELVTGDFEVTKTPDDASGTRRLQFVPTLATDNAYQNGGFRSGRTYLVQLVGGEAINGTVLRDKVGKALRQPTSFSFSTHEGAQPAQLFRNPMPGGPRVTKVDVTTAQSLVDVPLNLFGSPPTEVRVHFDQALNPADTNVPVSFDTDPLVRDITKRGRVYLEYDDLALGAAGDDTWIPADVALEENSLAGAVLALRPVGVLPNNANVRVIVQSTLEDIAGESNVADFAYDERRGEFVTSASYEQQWNGISEDFASTDQIDFGAAFPQGQAEVGVGFVKAGFEFEGNPTSLEFAPTVSEVILDTAFTQIVPVNGLPFTVVGGVFNFKNVTIQQGVTVLGQGPNPMVWLCSGNFRVAGTLSVRGGNGARVDTLQSANFAKAGGIGRCGGGNGGDGTPEALKRDLRGGFGRGPLQKLGAGGAGGRLACVAGCYQSNGGGSGGGGGTLATQGDPWYRGTVPPNINPNVGAPPSNTSFQQVQGFGGAGCTGASGARNQFLGGGEPGPRVFTDSRADNNYWGSAIDIARNIRITGELTVPMGGGGGGGGGDTSPSADCSVFGVGSQPVNDHSGGGGGGGGGALIIKALGEIEVTATGRIIADGGNGGGGEQAGASGEGGGGGAGAGGLVVLLSATRIILHAHGVPAANRFTYAQNDYDFGVSADGGVCTTGSFGSLLITGKYPASGGPMLAGATYDSVPLGALGGMGIVQLMVPPGTNTDGTNTLLDDNIKILRPNTNGTLTELFGIEKKDMLAWRGFATPTGQFVDDSGAVFDIGKNEGDIRPSPILMPVPFSTQSRIRSKWIDTGVSSRRLLAAPDGLPRGVVGTEAGPIYSFAGLDNSNATKGYVDYDPAGTGGVTIAYPTPVNPVDISSAVTGASHLGHPAYRVTLSTPALGEDNRYSQYQAELLDVTGSIVGSYRILQHTDTELLLDAADDVLPSSARRLQVRAKFFKIVTNQTEGLGPVYVPLGSSTPIPNSNVRFGFAFHQDPQEATGRFPTNQQEFLHDLEDPEFLAWVQANGAPRYVQWDILFDMTFKVDGSVPPALNPNSPRPEVHFLRLPFRF